MPTNTGCDWGSHGICREYEAQAEPVATEGAA
jgi:hypothetical protein